MTGLLIAIGIYLLVASLIRGYQDNSKTDLEFYARLKMLDRNPELHNKIYLSKRKGKNEKI